MRVTTNRTTIKISFALALVRLFLVLLIDCYALPCDSKFRNHHAQKGVKTVPIVAFIVHIEGARHQTIGKSGTNGFMASPQCTVKAICRTDF